MTTTNIAAPSAALTANEAKLARYLEHVRTHGLAHRLYEFFTRTPIVLLRMAGCMARGWKSMGGPEAAAVQSSIFEVSNDWFLEATKNRRFRAAYNPL